MRQRILLLTHAPRFLLLQIHLDAAQTRRLLQVTFGLVLRTDLLFATLLAFLAARRVCLRTRLTALLFALRILRCLLALFATFLARLRHFLTHLLLPRQALLHDLRRATLRFLLALFAATLLARLAALLFALLMRLALNALLRAALLTRRSFLAALLALRTARLLIALRDLRMPLLQRLTHLFLRNNLRTLLHCFLHAAFLAARLFALNALLARLADLL